MKLYHEYYHFQELDPPRKIGRHWRSHFYQKMGREVKFENLSPEDQNKFLNKGFAPAIPIEVSDYNCTSNYLYPINWNNYECPF